MAALFYHSGSVRDSFEHRLLEERVQLARIAGRHLEAELRTEISRVATLVGQLPGADDLGSSQLAAGLQRTCQSSLFFRDAFIVDVEGRTVVASHSGHDLPGKAGRLCELARKTGRAEAAGFAGATPSVIVVKAVAPAPSGAVRPGCVGGLVYGEALELGSTFEGFVLGETGELDLVTASGASLAPERESGRRSVTAHNDLLSEAIAEGRSFSGRCHRCHEVGAGEVSRDEDVLAFAPFPSFPLGIAVRQSEEEALAPATELRWKLILVEGLVLTLFLLAGAFLAHRVVGPVKRLENAVRMGQLSGSNRELPSLGEGEVGRLASVLNAWRSGLVEALSLTERQQVLLREEAEASNRLVLALDGISKSSLDVPHTEAIVRRGLEHTLDVLGFSQGALRMQFRDRKLQASRGLLPAQVDSALDLCTVLPRDRRGTLLASSEDGFVIKDIPGDERDGTGLDRTDAVLVAELAIPRGPLVKCVLLQPDGEAVLEERRLHSLLHHIAMSAANRILADEELLRQTQRRELLRRVLSAQEEERRRVARELHDTVSQDLSALSLQLERLAGEAPRDELANRVRDLEEQTRKMQDTVRRITLDLRPSVLDSMGFLPALQWHLERVERERGIKTRFVLEGEERELPPETTIRLFRIFQESLQNTVQHALAEHIIATVVFSPRAVTLTIEDDGNGFDVAKLSLTTPAATGRGLGLLGMEERAKLLNGTMEVDTAVGAGTTIRVTVPTALVDETSAGEEE